MNAEAMMGAGEGNVCMTFLCGGFSLSACFFRSRSFKKA